MAKPFDQQQDLNSRQTYSIIESVSVPGQAAQAVCNPDGTDIGSGGGSANVNIHDATGADLLRDQQIMARSLSVVIASDQTAIPITISPPSVALTPTSGDTDVLAGPTATPLSGASTLVSEVTIVSKLTNISNILLGDSATQNLQMEPGRDITIHNVDLNTIYIFGTAGEGVTYFATI